MSMEIGKPTRRTQRGRCNVFQRDATQHDNTKQYKTMQSDKLSNLAIANVQRNATHVTHLWILEELDKVSSGFLLVGRVFGKVAAGLSKEPDGRLFDGFAEGGPDHEVVFGAVRGRVGPGGRCRTAFGTVAGAGAIGSIQCSHENLAGQLQILLRRNGRPGDDGRRTPSPRRGRESLDAGDNAEKSNQCGRKDSHCWKFLLLRVASAINRERAAPYHCHTGRQAVFVPA